MKRHLVAAVLFVVTLCLIASQGARADITYSYSGDFSSIVGVPNSTVTFSFTVPTFITSDTTITSLTTASLGTGLVTCGTITDVMILNPTSTTFPGTTAPRAGADWSTPCLSAPFTGAGSFFDQPLIADGTYSGFSRFGVAEDATLTISGTPVPEPGTLALLGTGALGLFGPIRRKLFPWK